MASAARADPCPLSITGQRTGRKKGGNMDQYASIPAELKSMDQWVGFVLDYNEEKGKNDKIPIDPHKLTNAKANDPGTWGMYQSAFDCIGKKASYWVQRKSGWQKHEKTIDGIGFEFAGGIFGVDLDHVITQDGIDPAAQDIIETLDSYTEYSPSGTGVHILCKGTIPPGERKAGSAEMYSQGRFFTVTGKAFGPVKPLAERTAQAAAVHAKYFKKADPPAAQQAAPLPVFTLSQSDDEVLQRAFNSRNGDRIRALYAGDITAHNGADRSHSAADLALCSELAYWTNGDAAQIDRMFRRSALWRDKWDEKRGAKTYGEATIAAALKDFQPYIPRSTAEQDFTPVGSDGLGGLDELETARQERTGPGMVDSFLQTVQTRRYEPMQTGISDIDKAIGGGFIRQQLVLLGAAPGAGKTALAQWIFEGMAKRGTACIFLNLEMAQEQILARSLSRMAAQQGAKIKAIEILQGYKWTEQQRQQITAAAAAYKEEIAPRMIYNPQGVTANLDSILAYMKQEAQRAEAAGDQAPVCVLDYLQIVRGNDREDAAAVIKRAVNGFKAYAIKHNTLVFVIIAHNRESNKTGAVTMEAGRDTSALEYSADLQLALTYTLCMKRKDLDNLKPKSPDELTQEEKQRVTLKITKGRFTGGAMVDLLFNGETMTYTQIVKDFADDEPRRRRP
jgi:hypothetical protein